MAIGDDAAAAGLDLVPVNGAVGSPGKVKQGPQEFNRTRDYIAEGPDSWKPGVTPVSIAQGGTGSTSASAARTALGFPALGAPDVMPANAIAVSNASQQLTTRTPTLGDHAANKSYVDGLVGGGSYLPLAGGTLSGNLYLPASSAATSGWTAAYINSDGRVCRGASSARYKKSIKRNPAIPDVFGAPLASYQMRGDEAGTVRFGHIAEDLFANPGTQQFVNLDEQGRPDSYDEVGLLKAQVHALLARVEQLEASR